MKFTIIGDKQTVIKDGTTYRKNETFDAPKNFDIDGFGRKKTWLQPEAAAKKITDKTGEK